MGASVSVHAWIHGQRVRTPLAQSWLAICTVHTIPFPLPSTGWQSISQGDVVERPHPAVTTATYTRRTDRPSQTILRRQQMRAQERRGSQPYEREREREKRKESKFRAYTNLFAYLIYHLSVILEKGNERREDDVHSSQAALLLVLFP
ncbi:hypothetical protein LY76DRAFT_198315 [Colletotrichum caudatum]|nr:hypothetical protein LY76DRAFT_198315 [Colletotrichum caudatum]